ncbi:hypothetical protein EVAR_81902_1 [Eumeta japonica]|uniref:Uncharacterized protein n=1 Tax=Eumeta variegata TaxID=151549 RepID=A0A4C1UWX2_EUMVA|nr:hypothetical protein EVAR_81902_1 [Eumeta japonica]
MSSQEDSCTNQMNLIGATVLLYFVATTHVFSTQSLCSCDRRWVVERSTIKTMAPNTVFDGFEGSSDEFDGIVLSPRSLLCARAPPAVDRY